MKTQLTVVDTRFGEDEVLVIELDRYKANNQPVIMLTCENGEPYLTASVCLAQQPPKNCVWIKDYSENAGMAQLMVKAGVIHADIKATAQNGFVTIHAYQMTEIALDAFKQAA